MGNIGRSGLLRWELQFGDGEPCLVGDYLGFDVVLAQDGNADWVGYCTYMQGGVRVTEDFGESFAFLGNAMDFADKVAEAYYTSLEE